MLLKLKRAKFCFLCLRQTLPETETLPSYLTRQKKGQKNPSNKKPQRENFLRTFLLVTFMDTSSSSSPALNIKELYRVMSSYFLCALLCWSGNPTMESDRQKQTKAKQH